jgi:hypothetical protein
VENTFGNTFQCILHREALELDGYVTIWPAGKPMPVASVVQNNPKQKIMALAVNIPVGDGGEISIFTQNSRTHMVLDVTGYYVPVDVPAMAMVQQAAVQQDARSSALQRRRAAFIWHRFGRAEVDPSDPSTPGQSFPVVAIVVVVVVSILLAAILGAVIVVILRNRAMAASMQTPYTEFDRAS